MNEYIIFDGREFISLQALHEWRLIYDFDYFIECAEQNIL